MERKTLGDAELKAIAELVEREFSNDPALQQVHIARKIISHEAKNAGMSVLEYASELAKQTPKPAAS
jgi:hypothetical protein